MKPASTIEFGETTCATSAIPDETVTDGFDFDTAINDPTGDHYGQSACKDQFLVEIDLTHSQSSKYPSDFFGDWSTTPPTSPCDEQATMTIFGFNGSCWSLVDQIEYTAQSPSPGVCVAFAKSHTAPAQAGEAGTLITSEEGFQRLRIAINANENGKKVPIKVFGLDE